MKDKVKQSYKRSSSIYDDLITHRKWWSKLYIRLFWNGVDDNEIAREMLRRIPDDFSGELLDVPVGTAVFTYEKYKAMKGAKITCLDYSADMLDQAKARFSENGIANVAALQGDVGRLPFKDGAFDIVLSMNGFHVFPEKEKAWAEIFRVLKPGGRLIASFYIRGQSKVSDALVKAVLAKKRLVRPALRDGFIVEETPFRNL